MAADRFYFGPMFERQKVGKPVDDAGNVGRGRASGFGGIQKKWMKRKGITISSFLIKKNCALESSLTEKKVE